MTILGMNVYGVRTIRSADISEPLVLCYHTETVQNTKLSNSLRETAEDHRQLFPALARSCCLLLLMLLLQFFGLKGLGT